jgi:hypothetical protein
LKQFLAFIVVTAAWATAARLFLHANLVHPAAVGIVWIVGFVWMTGYIAAGRNSADLLTKRWLQMLAGIAVLAGFGFLVFS